VIASTCRPIGTHQGIAMVTAHQTLDRLSATGEAAGKAKD